jgi:hypothetical protein
MDYECCFPEASMNKTLPYGAVIPTADDSSSPPRWLRFGFWACILISVAVVIRRLVALVHPPRSVPPQLAGLDAVFASHTALTLAHILPALAFVITFPFLYMRRFAGAIWIERLFFPLGAIVGITAYAMSSDSIGGRIERSAVLVFNTLFLFSLLRAWQLRQNRALKLRWITRAIGILLGIATTRPVMAIFFATSPITHLVPRQFFGVAFWIGFSINTLVVEAWLRSESGRVEIERRAAMSRS